MAVQFEWELFSLRSLSRVDLVIKIYLHYLYKYRNRVVKNCRCISLLSFTFFECLLSLFTFHCFISLLESAEVLRCSRIRKGARILVFTLYFPAGLSSEYNLPIR